MAHEAKNVFGLVPLHPTETSPVATDYRAKIRTIIAGAQQLGFDRPTTMRAELSQGLQYPVLAPDISLPSPSPDVQRRLLQAIGYLNVEKVSGQSGRRPVVVYGSRQEPKTDLRLEYISTSGGQNFVITVGEDVTIDGSLTMQDAYEQVLGPLLEGRTRFDVFEAVSPAYQNRIRLDNQRDLALYERDGRPKPDYGRYALPPPPIELCKRF